MIDSVFGFGTMSDYDGGKQLCLYVGHNREWKKGYCSDYTEDEELKILYKLGFGSEMDAVFTILPSVEQMTKEEITQELTEAGFVYDEKFEAFMKDCLCEENEEDEEGWDD